jgi:phage repressor protein C with HTH and peptisase S24 domain
MEEDLFEKVSLLLSQKKVTNYKISKATGISETAIGRYVKGDKPTLANAKQIISFFENLSGVGGAKALNEFQFLNIPFIPVHAQGGYTKGYGDHEYIENLPTIPVIVDKNYKGKYRVFEVEGDSMDDGTRNALYNGDKILGREVKRELWEHKLHIKDWYFIIVMINDGITVKQIINHGLENGEIQCHPLNPMFEDFAVNLNDVAELYNVIKIVDRNTRI